MATGPTSTTLLLDALTEAAPRISEDTMTNFRILLCTIAMGLLSACVAPAGGSSAGTVSFGPLGGKADGSEDELCFELQGELAIAPESSRDFTVTAAEVRATLRVDSGVAAWFSMDEQILELTPGQTHGVLESAAPARQEWIIEVANADTEVELLGSLCVRTIADSPSAGISPELRAAALANLQDVTSEIDYRNHLKKYGLGLLPDGSERPVAEQFLIALETEYAQQPAMLQARMSALASMVFFAAPAIAPPPSGHATPFHGLDMSQFQDLINIEDVVWSHHESENGSKVGVRPFSVCETRYIIEAFVRPGASYDTWEAYKAGLDTFVAEQCTADDIAHWYNFRGLGHLRPTWIESNIMERVVRRMVGECDGAEIDPEWAEECAEWQADRFGYRDRANQELSSRFMFYDPADEDYMADPSNALVLLEDTTGDGVGAFLRPGDTTMRDGRPATLSIDSTGRFSGRVSVTIDGASENVAPGKVIYETSVHPDFDPTWWTRPDFGLQALFPDANPTGGMNGCLSANPSATECPLIKRFYVLIDRHENFYQTYSALRPSYNGRFSLSSQPSPLVACSVTLGAAHHWDSAGIPSGGNAGFIFLMKVPFNQVLTGSDKSVSSLPTAPDALSIQDLYRGETLDMSRVWLDIASLSNDLYSGENEISKYGAVPEEQLEGILVVRRPANMPMPADPIDTADAGTTIDGADAGMP